MRASPRDISLSVFAVSAFLRTETGNTRTHASSPPSPFLFCQCDSHTGATGGPQLLRLPVDASSPSTSRRGGSHTPRIVEPALLYAANTSMTTSAARAVLVGRFAGRSRASARDNGKRAEESLRMGASVRQAFCVGWVIQFPSYHLVSLDMLDTDTHSSFLHTL